MRIITDEEATIQSLKSSDYESFEKSTIEETCKDLRKKYPKAKIKVVDNGAYYAIYGDENFFLYEEMTELNIYLKRAEKNLKALKKNYDLLLKVEEDKIKNFQKNINKILIKFNGEYCIDSDRWICDQVTCYNVEENIKNGCTAKCEYHRDYKGVK